MSPAKARETAQSSPRNHWTQAEADAIYAVFRDPIHRAGLCSLIEGRTTVPSSPEIALVTALNDYVGDRNRFSSTFEWFVGELMIREFGALSASYGVEVKDLYRQKDGQAIGYDFDALCVLADVNLLFFECKTGALKPKSLENTLSRAMALHCTGAVVFLGAGITQSYLEGVLKAVTHPPWEAEGLPAARNGRCLGQRRVQRL